MIPQIPQRKIMSRVLFTPEALISAIGSRAKLRRELRDNDTKWKRFRQMVYAELLRRRR